jgi:hypothetical protein
MIIESSFYNLVSFLYSLLISRLEYFSSGQLSSFSVKLRYHPSVSVVNFENICVNPEKMLELLLWFVDPELIFLVVGSLGIFFLSLSIICLSYSTLALLE